MYSWTTMEWRSRNLIFAMWSWLKKFPKNKFRIKYPSSDSIPTLPVFVVSHLPTAGTAEWTSNVLRAIFFCDQLRGGTAQNFPSFQDCLRHSTIAPSDSPSISLSEIRSWGGAMDTGRRQSLLGESRLVVLHRGASLSFSRSTFPENETVCFRYLCPLEPI